MCGVSNTIGRAAFGVIADWQCVDTLTVHNWASLIAGINIVLLPLFPSAVGIALNLASFGFFIAAPTALATIILCEVLGIDQLTNAFGLLILSRGSATLVGLPLSMWVYELFGNSYEASFIAAGVLLIVCALMHFLLQLPQLRRRFKSPKKARLRS